jgi:hypothetical protein
MKLSKESEIELFDEMYCMPLQASNEVIKHYNAHNDLVEKLTHYRESIVEDCDALACFDEQFGDLSQYEIMIDCKTDK